MYIAPPDVGRPLLSPCACACVCVSRYFFSMNVEWSASVKEVSQNDFWTEVRGPRTMIGAAITV